MRLIVCSSNYPNPGEPNKGIFVYRTVRSLAEVADPVVVAPIPYFPRWLPFSPYAKYAAIPREAANGTVRVLYPRVLVTPKIGRSLYGLFYALGLYRTVARLTRDGKPDALLAYWAYPDGFASVVLAKMLKLPVFVGALGCDVNDLDRHLGKRRMVRWAFRRCDGAFAVSHALGSGIASLGVTPDRIRVVPNGVDDALLAPPTPGDEGPARGSVKTVLYCGRLSPEKDPLCLLDATEILLARQPDVRVTFIGDGPLRSRMADRISKADVADRVTLMGEIGHEAIAKHMRRADVLCLPSVREGHPNVVVEALASGVPVVASDVGGVREIVTGPELGILVPPGRPEALAAALEHALSRSWDAQKLRTAGGGRSWRDVARDTVDFMERRIR